MLDRWCVCVFAFVGLLVIGFVCLCICEFVWYSAVNLCIWEIVNSWNFGFVDTWIAVLCICGFMHWRVCEVCYYGLCIRLCAYVCVSIYVRLLGCCWMFVFMCSCVVGISC